MSAEVINLPRTTLGRWLLLDSLSWGPLAQTYGELVALIDWDILALDCLRIDGRFFGGAND
jgi:hypothetical protein